MIELLQYIETWGILQRLVAVVLCTVPIFGFSAVIYSFIVIRTDNRNRIRNSRHVLKGYDENGTPIHLEIPRE